MDTINYQMMTVAEVAKLFSCTQKHIYNLVSRKHEDFPPAIKIGGALRFMTRDIEIYIEAKKAGMPYDKFVRQISRK